MDAALERPVSHDRWGQILWTLEQLPLVSSANADVRHGAWRRSDHVCGCLRTRFPSLIPSRYFHREHFARAGLMLDTQDVSAVLMNKFELAFGFTQGERWFGTVVCDEHEDNERIRSGTFHGELVLISKRALPRHKVRINSESQELTLLDLNRDGTEISIAIPYKARVDQLQ